MLSDTGIQFRSNFNNTSNVNTIYCNMFSCERVYSPKKLFSNLKSNSLLEVCYIVSGEGIHHVLDQDIPCKKGDICVIPPGIPHGFFLNDADDSLIIRQILLDAFDWFDEKNIDVNSSNYCYGIFTDNRTIAYATLNSHMQERVNSLYDFLECEILELKDGWREMVKGYLVNLFISIGRYINCTIKNISFVSSKEWDAVSAVTRIVKEEYGDCNLTLNYIAGRIYVSQSHLSRVFKRIMGTTFSDYLRDMRIQCVCKLLESSNANIDEIAKSCGFRDISSFYKNFVAYTDMTPNEYRKKKQLSPTNSCKQRKSVKKEKTLRILRDISENLQQRKAKRVQELVKQALDEGIEPDDILNEGLLNGMDVIGEKFKNSEIFVPEVLVAVRAMNMGTHILKPYLLAKGAKVNGRVCIGTVQGDIHDIGKNIVKMMMESKGLEVIDLGTDVAPETFVQTAIEKKCQVICCSALLTTTMWGIGDVVKAAEAAGIRGKVKIMIGGAPVSKEFCRQIGADCYTPDAASAANEAVEFCKNKILNKGANTTMTGTERVRNTILGLPVDRQPIYGWVESNLKEQFAETWGSAREFEDHYEFDAAHIFGAPQPIEKKMIEKLREENEELTPDIVLEANLHVDPTVEMLSKVKKSFDYHKAKGRFCYVQTPGFFEYFNHVFGIQNHLMYLILYRDELAELYRRQSEWIIKFADLCIDMGMDCIHISDDWGSQKDLMFSPELWRELVKPNLKRVIDHVHSRGVFVSLHSDGCIDRVTDELVEIGIDMVHPWQESAGMSYDTYLEKYSDKFAILGGVCVQTALGIMPREQLLGEIRRVFSKLRGKRWICCTSHFVQNHCAMDDLNAAYDLIYELARS